MVTELAIDIKYLIIFKTPNTALRIGGREFEISEKTIKGPSCRRILEKAPPGIEPRPLALKNKREFYHLTKEPVFLTQEFQIMQVLLLTFFYRDSINT